MAIQVQGDKLYHRDSKNPIRLVGLNLQDPLWQRISPGPRLLEHGPSNLELARSWDANAVRIPFHPVTIRHAGSGDWNRGLAVVTEELDWIFLAAQALDLWVIIDFHSIGFPADETFFEFDEEPYENLYETSQYEIESFWRTIATRYREHPRLAAFELFNEATREAAFGNDADWQLHANWTEELLQHVIRPLAPHTLAIIGGLHFGYDLEHVLTRPIRDSNIAYSSHPYPHHSQAKTWDRAFGRLAKTHPVLLTELGFAPNGFFGRQHHRGFRDWELEIQSYADALELSFFAWNLSKSWEPSLLGPDGEPNEAGMFFRDWIGAASTTLKLDTHTQKAEEAPRGASEEPFKINTGLTWSLSSSSAE